MTGHDEHEKNNSKYLDNNDDLLCPVTYCAPVSPICCVHFDISYIGPINIKNSLKLYFIYPNDL